MAGSKEWRGTGFNTSLTSLENFGRMRGPLNVEFHHLVSAGIISPDQSILQYTLDQLRRKKEAEVATSEGLEFPAIAMLAQKENA